MPVPTMEAVLRSSFAPVAMPINTVIPVVSPENDARHSLHHLASDGHGGHARGTVVPPHHKQVGSP